MPAFGFALSTGPAFGKADGSDFNGFDAGLCESLAEALLAVLADPAAFQATALPALVTAFLAGTFELARAGLAAGAFPVVALEAVLGDFLRVFLDIRLPF